MSAKVLLCELRKIYSQGIYLDFGSALDFICTKKDSRGWSSLYKDYTYNFLEKLLSEIIPDNWNDTIYDTIYDEARYNLGTQLPS
jgi:hypothetical protein